METVHSYSQDCSTSEASRTVSSAQPRPQVWEVLVKKVDWSEPPWMGMVTLRLPPAPLRRSISTSGAEPSPPRRTG